MSDDQFTQFPEDADPVGLTGGPDGVTQYDVNDDGIADIAVTVHGDVMVVENEHRRHDRGRRLRPGRTNRVRQRR